MAIHRFDVIHQLQTEVPNDIVVNTWHFENTGPVTDYDNVRDMLADFYEETPDGASGSVGTVVLAQGNILESRVRAYNLDEPPPRQPVYESTFEVTGSVGSALPYEVAMVLSFEAEPQSGQPQNRRRNRKFLGPIRATAVTSTGLFTTVACETVAAAARDMLQAAQASATWNWRVWSQTDQTAHHVHQGWVDNSPDTQRRRGQFATERVDWSDSLPETP